MFKKISSFQLKLVLVVSFGFLIFSLPATVQARVDPTNGTSTQGTQASCQHTKTPTQLEDCIRNNKITKDLNKIINFLSGAVGLVVIAMLILGGIQYMAAGANPQAVTAAKGRITNALIALFVFIFAFAFLQWLVPGGIFG